MRMTFGGEGIGRVLAAEGVSKFGAMPSRLAIPWLAALVLNATPMPIAILLLAEAAAGLRAVWQRPKLRALAAIESLLAFGMALSATSYMIFVSRDIGLPPASWV